MSELLRVEGLHIAVEGKEILKGLDLTINTGETHVIMGSNGAGKSTLFNAIMGNPKYVVTAGRIFFEGRILLTPPSMNAPKPVFLWHSSSLLLYRAFPLKISSAMPRAPFRDSSSASCPSAESSMPRWNS